MNAFTPSASPDAGHAGDTGRPSQETPSHSAKSTARSSCWRLIWTVAALLIVAAVLTVLFVLPLDAELYRRTVGRVPVVLYLHGYLERLLGGRLVGPFALYDQRIRAFEKSLEVQELNLFAHLQADQTFTRFENSRIFFRPLRRRLTTSGATGASSSDATPRAQWAMAELTGRAAAAANEDGRHSLRCAGPLTTLTYSASYYSPYGDIVKSSALDMDHSPTQVDRLTVPCEHHMALLMCVGDAWEIACPPEAQKTIGGNPLHPRGWGQSVKDTGRLMYSIIRLQVDNVSGTQVATESDVAEELAYRVLEPGQAASRREGESVPPSSPAPFSRLDMLRKVESHPYQSVFIDFST